MGSAKMKPTTPPNVFPPFQRTAASGTLPIEQTKLDAAISGPMSGPQSEASAGLFVRKNPDQKAMIDALSQFGILLLLLLTGMETDLKLVRQTGPASVSASLMGTVTPLPHEVALGDRLPDPSLPGPGSRPAPSLAHRTRYSHATGPHGEAVSTASVGDLFIAGVVPGLLLALLLGITTWYRATKFDYPRMQRATWTARWKAFRDASGGLRLIVILIGGI